MPDSELLDAIATGSQTAFRELFDRYYVPLCKQAAMRLGGDTVAAEDVVQQVFIDFWDQQKSKVVDSSVGGYLSRMVKFKAVDLIRKNETRRTHENRSHDSVSFVEEEPEQTQAALLEAALRQEIASLPEQCCAIFTTVYLEGKKYREAAELHGVSINTIKEQLKRAMVKLRGRLKDWVPCIIWFLSFLSPLFDHLNDHR